MVHRPRDILQGAVDGKSLHLASLRVHQVDLAGVSFVKKRVQIEHLDPYLGEVSRDAHNGNRTGMEDVVQGMRVAPAAGECSSTQSFQFL